MRRCVCSVLTRCHVFPFLFVFVLFLLFTVLPTCLTRRPSFCGAAYLTTKTLSDTDSWTSSNRNIKDATRTTLRYTFGMNGIPTVISESSPAQ